MNVTSRLSNTGEGRLIAMSAGAPGRLAADRRACPTRAQVLRLWAVAGRGLRVGDSTVVAEPFHRHAGTSTQTTRRRQFGGCRLGFVGWHLDSGLASKPVTGRWVSSVVGDAGGAPSVLEKFLTTAWLRSSKLVPSRLLALRVSSRRPARFAPPPLTGRSARSNPLALPSPAAPVWLWLWA